ncbi:MAG: FAD-dependent oxidoreductase, partial [SAR202 cluster bacterium]|nr:FAD-dependent oxidoreductase [SAR202 cluster bacterium]
MKVGIVGAGVFGVASALELRRRGHDVTVFEQGRVPNERASSTDVAKVIRRLGYGANVPGMPSNEAYLELVLRASA